MTEDGLTRDVRHRIVEALYRNAAVDAKKLSVTVAGHVATLKGTVNDLVPA